MEMSEKKQIAILSLVAGKSRAESAKLAGCSESTIYEWLSDRNFQTALKDARSTVFESETSRLHGLAAMAIESLKRGLRGKAKAVEVRAAIAVFNQIRLVREGELLERIERLEEILEAKKQ